MKNQNKNENLEKDNQLKRNINQTINSPINKKNCDNSNKNNFYHGTNNNINNENDISSDNSDLKSNQTNTNKNFFNGKQDFDDAILEAFREFDKDHTDFITKVELGKFMSSLGYTLTEIELEQMINDIDEDGNGLIGIKEFRNLLTKSIKDELTINTSLEAFGIFDKYKCEKINKDNLKEILLSDNGDINFTREEVDEILILINKDENDDINYRDLIKNSFDIFNTEDIN